MIKQKWLNLEMSKRKQAGHPQISKLCINRAVLRSKPQGNDKKEVFYDSAVVRGMQGQPKWKEKHWRERVRVDWELNLHFYKPALEDWVR